MRRIRLKVWHEIVALFVVISLIILVVNVVSISGISKAGGNSTIPMAISIVGYLVITAFTVIIFSKDFQAFFNAIFVFFLSFKKK
jgi:hypothetical protein